MKRRGTGKKFGVLLSLVLMLMLVFSFGAMAASTDTDNSLVGLGITTEGAVLQEADFGPSTWTSHVTVPGTVPELEMEPQRSSGNATIGEIRYNDNEDGSRTYVIPVTSGSGDLFEYNVIVTATGETEAETEEQTEAVTEVAVVETEAAPQKETEPETQSNQVLVDRGTIEDAENTINDLQSQIRQYRESIDLYTKIIYGLIAFAVILLFVVINLLLRKRDLKMELNDYRSLGYSNSPKEQKKRAKEEKRAAKEQAKAEKKNGQQAPQGNVKQAPQANRPAPQQKAPQQNVNRQNAAPAQQAGTRQAGPSGVKAAQYYGPKDGVDVKPQVSQKRKQMPSYEQAPKTKAPAQTQVMPPVQRGQAPAQQAPKQAPQGGNRPAAQPKNKEVSVEMIDL